MSMKLKAKILIIDVDHIMLINYDLDEIELLYKIVFHDVSNEVYPESVAS